MNDGNQQQGPNLIESGIRFVQRAVQEPVQQRLKEHGDDQHRKGFTQAASISLGFLQAEIDLLKERMKGPGLAKSEQARCANLEELKSKIESDFDRYWRGSDVDWRPRKPVAKARIVPRDPDRTED